MDYRDALKLSKFKLKESYRENLCDNLFRSVMLDTNHKNCDFLLERKNSSHFLRNENNFNIPPNKTDIGLKTHLSLPCATSLISHVEYGSCKF